MPRDGRSPAVGHIQNRCAAPGQCQAQQSNPEGLAQSPSPPDKAPLTVNDPLSNWWSQLTLYDPVDTGRNPSSVTYLLTCGANGPHPPATCTVPETRRSARSPPPDTHRTRQARPPRTTAHRTRRTPPSAAPAPKPPPRPPAAPAASAPSPVEEPGTRSGLSGPRSPRAAAQVRPPRRVRRSTRRRPARQPTTAPPRSAPRRTVRTPRPTEPPDHRKAHPVSGRPTDATRTFWSARQ